MVLSISKKDKICIDKLQNDFVIYPFDKTSTNYAVICKIYYLKIIMGELDKTDFYKKYKLNKSVLMKKFNAFALTKNQFKIGPYNFPFHFATPKFHKTPVKFCFICPTINSIVRKFNILFEKKNLKEILIYLKELCGTWFIYNSIEVVNCVDYTYNTNI